MKVSTKTYKRANKYTIATLSTRNMGISAHANEYTKGFYGEILAKKHIELFGANVSYMGDCGVGYDLLVENNLRVEVKTASRGKDGKWNFALSKSAGDIKRFQDITKADVVILQCIIECGNVVSFVVPVDVLKDNKYVKITSHPNTYAGKLAQYRII